MDGTDTDGRVCNHVRSGRAGVRQSVWGMKLTDLAWLDDAKTEGSGIQSAHRILFDKSFERRSDSAFALYRRGLDRKAEEGIGAEISTKLDTEFFANFNFFF